MPDTIVPNYRGTVHVWLHLFSDLTPGTTYNVKLAAATVNGTGPWTDPGVSVLTYDQDLDGTVWLGMLDPSDMRWMVCRGRQ